MKDLASLADLDAALGPAAGPVVLYKHSTQCSQCDAAIEEVQAFEEESPEAATVYYLDLWAHRDLSDAVARKLGVRHESPQAIVLRGGKPVAVFNHRAVRADALGKAVRGADSASQKA
jgi:bacillithiol system protein YtxJ